MIFANGPQGKFTYTRKPGGQVESVSSGTTDGASATYDYNSLNLIRSISSGTQSYSLTYDAVGNLVNQSFPKGMGVTYVYDDLNRLKSLMVYNSSATLASYTYSLGPSGNRIGVTETGGRAVTWIPDDLYRLTSEGITNSTVNGSVSYVMDSVGNRLIRSSDIAAIPTQTFSGAYDLNDRCTATGFIWDANGNMLTDLQGRTFTYDPLNRLTSVTGTGVAVSYVYNADNLRVKKINSVSGITTDYHWDMANVTGYPQVLEEIENGSVVCRYAYGPTGVLSQSRKVNGSWVTSYFGKDAQSVRFLMDESGNITDSWTWDAYGNLLGRTGSTACNLGFDGEYMEPETGLVYLRARWYDPATGRFLQMDSYEGDKNTPFGNNKYLAFLDDPINGIDPSGNSTVLGNLRGILAKFKGLMPARVNISKMQYEKIDENYIGGLRITLGASVVGKREYKYYRWIQYVTTDAPKSGEGINSPYLDGGPGARPPFYYPDAIEKSVLKMADDKHLSTIFNDNPKRSYNYLSKSPTGSIHWSAELWLVGVNSFGDHDISEANTVAKVTYGFDVVNTGRMWLNLVELQPLVILE